MTTINAWQHIYSNVEKEHSPQGRGGFQTLFYSHNGLSEDEVEEMESYLLYFPSDVEPVKRLFFTTSTGKGVVAQIVFLPSPDQFGRGGRYLAHSLVFAPDDLLKFEVDPFRVFRQFSYVTTIDNALARGNFNTGDIPPVSLDLPDTSAEQINAARNWSTTELKKLSLLALRAEQQGKNREATTITGQPEEITQALQAAFLAVPVANRTHCSFDTYFYRCNLVATYFWAIGLPEPPVSIKFAQIDGSARQVQGQVTSQPETAYERWIVQEIDSGNLDGIARSRNYAFALGEWLDGRAYDLDQLNAASNNLITSMFTVSASSVQQMLRSQIRQKLPVSLVDRAAEMVYRQASALELYRQLRQGFELSPLVDVLYQSYAAENFKAPARQEIKDLAELLPQVEHPLFQLFIAYWTSPRKELPTALERTTENNYRQFAELSKKLDLLKPYVLLVPGRGDAFLDLYLIEMKDDLLDLSEALIDVGDMHCLVRLNPYLSNLSGKDLKKLAGLAEEHTGIPESFQTAVNQAIAAQPEKTGITKLLRKVFRRTD